MRDNNNRIDLQHNIQFNELERSGGDSGSIIYNRNYLLQFHTDEFITKVENFAKSIAVNADYLVFSWDSSPELLRDLCYHNGGDEDWIIVTILQNSYQFWIDRLDAGYEPDIYKLNGVTVYVASHS